MTSDDTLRIRRACTVHARRLKAAARLNSNQATEAGKRLWDWVQSEEQREREKGKERIRGFEFAFDAALNGGKLSEGASPECRRIYDDFVELARQNPLEESALLSARSMMKDGFWTKENHEGFFDIPCAALARELARRIREDDERPLTEGEWWEIAVLFMLAECPEVLSMELGLPVELPVGSLSFIEENTRMAMRGEAIVYSNPPDSDVDGPYIDMLRLCVESLCGFEGSSADVSGMKGEAHLSSDEAVPTGDELSAAPVGPRSSNPEVLAEATDWLVTKRNLLSFLGHENANWLFRFEKIAPQPVWSAERCSPIFRLGDLLDALVSAAEHEDDSAESWGRKPITARLRRVLKIPSHIPEWADRASRYPRWYERNSGS